MYPARHCELLEGQLDLGPYCLLLSPDFLSKIDVSGSYYWVTLPYVGFDPPLEGEVHRLSLLGYLELAARCRGFPGLGELADDALRRVLFD